MRLLVLSNHYPPHSFGSYDKQCYLICRELAERGHEIHVLTSRPPIGAKPAPSSRIFRELELYEEEPEREPGFQRLFGLVRSNRRILEKHLAHIRPEAVMIWGMERLPTSLLEVLESSRIPCLYSIYDYWLANACDRDAWGNYWTSDPVTDSAVMRPLLRSLGLEKFVLKRAALGTIDSLQLTHVYFCSEALKRKTIEACGRPINDAKTIPCGIAPEEIRARQGPQTTQRFRIAYMARLNPEKDPLTAIRAIQELRHRGDNRFSLDIYGRGSLPFEGSLHDYVRRFTLSGEISFKPAHDEQVNHRIHLYDALVFTSTYAEPFPLIHLKAMAARVPVISTLTGGSAELIQNGENGLAFDPRNHTQLADQLGRLADNPELAEKMAEAAYANVTQRYTIARVGSKIESLLYGLTQAGEFLESAV